MSERKTKIRRKLAPEIARLADEVIRHDDYHAAPIQHRINSLHGAIDGVSQHRQRQRARRAWKGAKEAIGARG